MIHYLKQVLKYLSIANKLIENEIREVYIFIL